jgi:hypothetical protein
MKNADLQSVLALLVSVVTIFLIVSYVASNVTEALAAVFNWRSNCLLRAIKNLLKDVTFNGLARDIYNNPKVNPFLSHTVAREAELKIKPRSIDPFVFAEALIEAVGLIDSETGQLAQNPQHAIRDNISNDELKVFITSLLKKSNSNLDLLRTFVADWYSRAADEMVLAYQHRTQLTSFLVGFALAVLLDLEPIPLGDLTSAGVTPRAGVNVVAIVSSLFEWLVVGMSTLFGARSWYSVLQWAMGESSNARGKGADTPQVPGSGGPGGLTNSP